MISCVSSPNVSTLAVVLFIVSSKSSRIYSFLSFILTLSLFVWFSPTSSILSFTKSLSPSILLQIFSGSKSEIQPFFLISLAWSHNRCSVISKTLCSFHSCIDNCLYPLIGLRSLSTGLILNKHSITILFTFLGHFVLTVVGWQLGPRCLGRELLPHEELSPAVPALITW